MRPATFALAFLIAFASQSALAAERIVLPTDVVPLHYEISIVPDATAMAFTGAVKIDIEVRQRTSRIVLNAADLTFSHVALSGVAAEPKVVFDPTQETASLDFTAPIAPGRYVLSIDYAGKINNNAAGLFYLDYEAAGGQKRALFTQFENSDARRFVPCWDEPARKATFTLTVTVPVAEMAVSNMPVASEAALPGGLKRVAFQPSPKMSSYLLFFGLGDFERISRPVNGVDAGVVVKHGDTEEAQYALDAEAQILPYYDDYFATNYPLPKLDLIAGPGQSQFFGAMENWGAIFFFERDLLFDPKISTEDDKRGIYITIAHEMSHQWFGDLVTMAWWDDLWLNEGFASWMELKATDHFHPEWQVWLEALDSKERAMRVDARAGTHPIVQPIADVLQANEAFDTITYSKGQAVIRMLENYIGEDAFRAGVRNYMLDHAYSNTVTDDLWAELDKTASAPISDIAHDFTLQAGIPLIRVASTPRGIRLSQDRFAADESGDANASWRVPVIEKPLGGKSEWRGLVSRNKPADIALPKGAVPIVNASQAGYFRTLYDKTLSAKLARHFAALSPADQLGLVNDGRALGLSGYEPLPNLLALMVQARPSMSPYVLADIADQIAGLDLIYRDLPGRKAFRAYGLKVLRPLFAKVGWTAKPGEGGNISVLRDSLLDALSELDDPVVIAEARKRFAGFVAKPDSLTGDLRTHVLDIAADHADAKTWEQLHALAKAAKSSLETHQFYVLLGRTHDKGLAARALDLAMTDEAPTTMRPTIISAVSAYYPDMAFDFVAAHADAVNAILEPDSRNEYAPRLASGSNDPAMLAKLDAYAAAHISPSALQATVKAKATITYVATVRAKRLPQIDRWLKPHRR